MEDVNCLLTMSTQPQAYVASELIMLTPVPPPCYLTISHSGNCAQAVHIPFDTCSLIWLLKVICKDLSGSSGFFEARATHLLAWLCNKTFLCCKL